MPRKYKIAFLVLLVFAFVALFVVLLKDATIPVLNPRGIIASKEHWLIVFTTLLAVLIVVPVFVMLFVIAWKYRADNPNAQYKPNWDTSRLYESLWWGIPCVIIAVLAVVTWFAAHDLDPYKKLDSAVKPVKVQVVSLQWKWLFIYPEQHVASVNFLQLPVGTPINFEITSDAPMNSFWIPSLGGQVYAMSGMSTKLHLMADKPGDYYGSSANISGEGFAGMKFTARASSRADFDTWVTAAQRSPQGLDAQSYATLAQPSKDTPAANYSLKQPDLYDTIVMKYMAPEGDGQNMPGMNMTNGKSY